MAAYPAFFTLYPTLEKMRNVRGLEYSNGVRALPLWLAYTAFDFIPVLLSSAVAVAVFAAVSSVWYHVSYLFVVFFLYGLASILLAYCISLFAKTQLSAYAYAAAGQAIMFLIYMIAYLCVLTYVVCTAPKALSCVSADINRLSTKSMTRSLWYILLSQHSHQWVIWFEHSSWHSICSRRPAMAKSYHQHLAASFNMVVQFSILSCRSSSYSASYSGLILDRSSLGTDVSAKRQRSLLTTTPLLMKRLLKSLPESAARMTD
jgi:hypothetical protein